MAPNYYQSIVGRFLSSQSWDATRAYLEATPDLLTDEADQVLEAILHDIPENLKDVVQQHRNFLRRSRSKGVPVAFKEALTTEYVINAPVQLRSEMKSALDCSIAFHDTSNFKYLKQGILTLQRAASNETFRSASSVVLAGLLSDLSSWGNLLADSQSDFSGINATVEVAEQLQSRSVDAFVGLNVLMFLSMGLRSQYRHSGNIKDLNRAVEAAEAALLSQLSVVKARITVLGTLADCLTLRFDRTADASDLERAIGSARSGLELSRTQTDDRAMLLTSLGNALLVRHDREGSDDDLDEAIEAFEEVQKIVPQKPLSSGNLGNALWKRFLRTGKLDDLDQSISFTERAISLAGRTSRHFTMFHANIGTALQRRFSLLSDETDATRAIESLELVVALTSQQDPWYGMHLGNLGNALVDRQRLQANASDLNRAIDLFNEALSTSPPESVFRASLHDNLANAYQVSYELTGKINQLSLAREQGDLASQHLAGRDSATPLHSLTRSADEARLLSNQATRLRLLFELRDDKALLEQAIEKLRKAVTVTPENHSALPGYISNLATSLRTKYHQPGEANILDEAVALFRRAVRLTGDRETILPLRLNNLANSLNDRFIRSCDRADVDESVNLLRKAEVLFPRDSPEQALVLGNLGSTLADRYRHFDSQADMKDGIAASRAAGAMGLKVSIQAALKSSVTWLTWAFEREAWEEVAEASDVFRAATSRLLSLQASRSDKESWIKYSRGILSVVMYSLCRLERPQEAVAVAEELRARLLAETMRDERRFLARLEAVEPDLLHEYVVARKTLEALQRRTSVRETAADEFHEEVKRNRTKLKDVVSRISQLDGFGAIDTDTRGTVNGTNFDSLDATSAIVYMATTSKGSIALIVDGNSEISVVWPTLDTESLESVLVQPGDTAATGGYLTGQLQDVTMLPHAIDSLLPLLGSSLMKPVVDYLLPLSRIRMTLIPIGQLGLLPLHAATLERNDRARCVLDDFCVNYAPNAGSVRESYRSIKTVTPPCLFAVANTLPSSSPLPFAERELNEIEATFNGEQICLYGKQATRGAVLKDIERGTHLHFACHGAFDAESPQKSCLFLAEERTLSLQDLIEKTANISNARLAVLSACQSAISDPFRLPDEVIGLPVGFLQASVPGVVGSLWPVNDLSTSLLMAKFYELLSQSMSSGDDNDQWIVAECLRTAQLWLRDSIDTQLTGGAQKENVLRNLSDVKESDSDSSRPDRPPYAHPYFWASFQLIGL